MSSSQGDDSRERQGEEAWKAFLKGDIHVKEDSELQDDSIVCSALICRMLKPIVSKQNIGVSASPNCKNDEAYLSPGLYKLFSRFYDVHLINLERQKRTREE